MAKQRFNSINGFAAHEGLDGVLRIPRVGNLNKRPAPKATVIVDGRNPERPGRGDFGCLVFARLAAYFLAGMVRALTHLQANSRKLGGARKPRLRNGAGDSVSQS